MNRQLIFVLPALLIMSGCVRTSANRSASEPSSTKGAGSGSSYAANAAKITDACTLMPADLVKQIVPNADAPVRDQILKRCSVSNGTSVLEITLETGIITPTDPVNGAEFVPGLALGGYPKRLDPKARDDTSLNAIFC